MKLQAKDFRIGNLIVCVDEISEVDIQAFQNIEDGYNFYKAIPLTDEWLQKFGLEERYAKGEWSWYKCKKEGQWDSYTEIRKEPDGYRYIGRSYKPIRFVHELQNIYQSLTGEELELK